MYRVTVQSDIRGYEQFDYKKRTEALSKLIALASYSLKDENFKERLDTFTIERL